jgi:hypothetical protein
MIVRKAPRSAVETRRFFTGRHREDDILDSSQTQARTDLFTAVVFHVGLGSLSRMMDGVLMMAVSGMCMVGSLLVVARLVMLRSFSVMMRGVVVVLGCLLMMLTRLF